MKNNSSPKDILKNKILAEEGLTFDDILLLPNYTDIKRDEVTLETVLHPKIKLQIPVISSPMDTVTEEKMAIAMAENGGLGIIHRNINAEEQAKMVQAVKNKNLLVGAAVGVGRDLEERVKLLVQAGADVLTVDSAHGHSKFIIEAVEYIKAHYPDMVIMAGNVATEEGAKALIQAGTDILRVGIGPGSICTTRIISGMGVPQITAIMEVVKATENTSVTVIADGGIKQTGDMAKALGCGAKAVMLGSLLARFDESPGETITIENKQYKMYRGMGSVSAMKKGSASRYGQANTYDEKKLIAEGVEGLVDYKGKVSDYLFQIAGSLRSSFYYLGSRDLQEFFEKSRFVKITNAGLKESHPHSIQISEGGGNYNVK